MILAGDIGGTKTVLAIYAGKTDVPANPVHEIRFECADYQSFETIVKEFLDRTGATPQAACIGVAGPVEGRHSQVTNLPGKISADDIEHFLRHPQGLFN